MNAWLNKLYETFIETGHYNLIIEGFKNTILITLGALVIGVVIGMIIAVPIMAIIKRLFVRFVNRKQE